MLPRRRRLQRFSAAVLAAATADRDVAERAAFGPVAPAAFAEVPRLGQAVVVVVTEFGVGGGAARAIGCHLDAGFPPGTLLLLFHWRWEVMRLQQLFKPGTTATNVKTLREHYVICVFVLYESHAFQRTLNLEDGNEFGGRGIVI